jgi:hypothetical protein
MAEKKGFFVSVEEQQGMFECAICFQEYDWGYMQDRHICSFCNQKPEIYKDGIHPVTQTPKVFCKCGKPWNGWCSMLALYSLWHKEPNPEHANPNMNKK